MNESRTLHLRFLIKSHEALSPADAIGLFECAEDFSRNIFIQEISGFLEYLGMTSENRINVLQQINMQGRRTPLPAEIKSFERGSWFTDIILSGASVLIWKEYIHPVVKEAWNDSIMRDKMYKFFRDVVFRGAKEKVENKAIQYQKYRNLRVKNIIEVPDEYKSDVRVGIELEKQSIYVPQPTDIQLIEEFIERINR